MVSSDGFIDTYRQMCNIHNTHLHHALILFLNSVNDKGFKKYNFSINVCPLFKTQQAIQPDSGHEHSQILH